MHVSTEVALVKHLYNGLICDVRGLLGVGIQL